MSEIYRTTVFEKIKIEITTLTQAKLLEIEEKLEQCLKQKFTKLASLLKNGSLVTVCHDGNLLFYDKFSTLLDFEQIVKAFGMDVKVVDSELRGRCYVVSDKITELLGMIQSDFQLSTLLSELGLKLSTNNGKLSEQLRALIEQNQFDYSQLCKNGDLIAEVCASLRQNGSFNIDALRKVEQTRDRWRDVDVLVSSREVGVTSDKANVEQQLKQFVTDVDTQLQAHNKHMQNGVTEVLYSRATQLGYSVQKQQKGDTIQLVMVGVQ